MKIVVLTCDKYSWLVPIFERFYKKNWPDNPYQTIVITETESSGFGAGDPYALDWPVFYTQGVSWSSGILNYLSTQPDDEKFLLTPEDYIIKSPVDTEKVRRAEELCSGNVGCVRLNVPDKYFKRHAVATNIKHYKEYPLDKPYSMSMQAAIWQKRYLMDVLRHNEDAWQAELNGSERLKSLKPKWRVLWTKAWIIDYEPGGIMLRGRFRLSVVKWALEELIK